MKSVIILALFVCYAYATDYYYPQGKCHNNPCQHGGTCSVKDDGYVCYCKPEFCGRHCEDHNQCHPNPCKYGGRCEREGREGYKCHCQKGYFGRHCDNDRNYY